MATAGDGDEFSDDDECEYQLHVKERKRRKRILKDWKWRGQFEAYKERAAKPKIGGQTAGEWCLSLGVVVVFAFLFFILQPSAHQ